MTKGLISILFTVFLLAFGMSFVSPIIPLLLKNMGASTAIIGQIQTTYFLSFTIASSLLGRIINRSGSKKLILTGLFIFGMAILCMPLVPSPRFFYLLRILQGIGSALLFAPTEAAINIISPAEKRATNMGLYGLVFAVGFALGPGIGASLYALQPSVPFTFAAMSCLVAMVVLILGFDETPIPVKKSEWGFFGLLNILRVPLTAAACYSVVEVSIGSFLSLYLDELAIKGGALGLVFTIFAVGGALSPYPAGKIADRYGKLPVLKACGLILLAVTVSFNFFQHYAMICILSFGVGVVAGALYPVALALIGELVPPQQMGTANASFSFFYGLGSIAGPLVTGWVLELFSLHYLFYPMSAAALIFVILTLGAPAHKRGADAVETA